MVLINYTDFSGGVNDKIGPVLDDSRINFEGLYYAHASNNWRMDSTGLIRFEGHTAVLSSAISSSPKCTGAFEYGGIILACFSNGQIYKIDGATATSLYSGFTTGDYYCTATPFGTKLIICNGQDTPAEFNGTTISTISVTDPNSIWSSAKPKGVAEFRGRLFFWGDPSNPHKLYTPAPGTINDFTTANGADAFNVAFGYGGVVTMVRAITDNLLIIYKQSIIRALEGTDPFGSTGSEEFKIRIVTDEGGCPAGRTVVPVGLDHYFLGAGGFKQLRPINAYGDVTAVEPGFLAKEQFNAINYGNATAIANAMAVYLQKDNTIVLAVPVASGTTNTQIFYIDLMSSAVRSNGQSATVSVQPRSGFSPSYLAYINRRIWHGDYAGQLYQHENTNSYNGATINATWESKWVAHGGVANLKRYKRLTLWSEGSGPNDIILQWQVASSFDDFSGSETQTLSGGALWNQALWNQATWSSGSRDIFDLFGLGRGRALKLRVINNTSDEKPIIRQIALEYDLLGARRG